MENIQKEPKIEHENFKAGQGYGSSEPGAESQDKQSDRQYGDNPLPPSGGEWRKAGEMQPEEDPEGDEPSAKLASRATKIDKQDDALHH